jgi:peptidoglycan-associated lipoprotein
MRTTTVSTTNTRWRSWGFLLLAAGCGHAAPPPPATAAQSAQARDPHTAALSTRPASSEQRCELPTIYFDFDSALLSSEARDAVVRSGTCYMNHALPERLVLAGATDARGPEEYNLALGQRRASSVRSSLVSIGIPESRIAVTSVGEEQATGRDETGYRLDRRVASSTQ